MDRGTATSDNIIKVKCNFLRDPMEEDKCELKVEFTDLGPKMTREE